MPMLTSSDEQERSNKRSITHARFSVYRAGAIIALLVLSAGLDVGSPACAHEYEEVKTIALQDVANTSAKWNATAYQLKGDDARGVVIENTNLPAKVCFWRNDAQTEQQCFLSENEGSLYQDVEQLSLVQLRKNGKGECGVLFVARNLTPGVGKLRLFSIWAYDKQGQRFVNLLPPVRLSDVSEYKIFSGIRGSTNAIFVVADRIWKTGEEPLYGGRHQFVIDIYTRSKNGFFALTAAYVTKKRYLTIDIQDDYGVITNEQKNIEKYAGKNRKGR